MMTLESILGEYWKEQFHAFLSQEEEEDDDVVIAVRAKRIAKEIALRELNHGLADCHLSKTTPKRTSTAAIILSDILVNYQVPVCLAAACNTTAESMESCWQLIVEVARQVDASVVEALLQVALQASAAALDAIRVCACQLLARLLVVAGTTTFTSQAQEALVERLTDKSIAVRAAAIQAAGLVLSAATDNVDDDDEVLLEALLWNVWHEPSVPNRVLALQALPVCNNQSCWDHVIARLRDTKEKVRVAAVQVLYQLTALGDLAPEQWAAIVTSGLGGTSETSSVRCQATKDATIQWVCTHFMKLAKFSLVNLLNALDVMQHPDEANQVLQVILQVASAAEDSMLSTLSPPEKRAFQASIGQDLIPIVATEQEEYTLAHFFLARVAAASNETYLTKVVPDMGVLCDVIAHYSTKLIETMNNNNDNDESQAEQALLTCVQLLQLATLIEEEGSRRRLTTLLQALMISTPFVAGGEDELVEAATRALLTLHGTATSKSNNNNRRRPEEAAVTSVLEQVMQHLTKSNDDMSLAKLRVLAILSVVLEEASPESLVGMRAFFQDSASTFVLETLQDENALIREAGVSCLGKLGLMMMTACHQDVVLSAYKPLLLGIAANVGENWTIRSQAVMALADWAMVLDQVLVNEGLVDILHDFLAASNSSVAAIAAEVTAKLLFANRCMDSTLLARLLVLFLDPNLAKKEDSEDMQVGSTTRMQQWLSLFFPAYCLQSALHREAVLGSLETALGLAVARQATKTTKKRTILYPVVKLVEFVCSVVTVAEEEQSQEHEGTEQTNVGLLVAIQVAHFLLQQQEEEALSVTQLRGLAKLLGSLDVMTSAGKGDYQHLQQTLEDLGMIVTDNATLKSLTPLMEDLANREEEDENVAKGRPSSAPTIIEDLANPEEENVATSGRPSSASTITEVSVQGRTTRSSTSSSSAASTVTELSQDKENTTTRTTRGGKTTRSAAAGLTANRSSLETLDAW